MEMIKVEMEEMARVTTKIDQTKEGRSSVGGERKRAER
jgi:hypothetical protein